MVVTYDTGKPAIQWRCALYSFCARPSQLISLVALPLALGYINGRPFFAGSISRLLLVELFSLAVWTLLLGAFLAAGIMKRTRTGSRVRTTVLMPTGFLDIAPDTQQVVPWTRVLQVRCHNGDVHFLTVGGGIFIPREAFRSLAEAQAFAEAAEAARRGDSSRVAPHASAGQFPYPPAALRKSA